MTCFRSVFVSSSMFQGDEFRDGVFDSDDVDFMYDLHAFRVLGGIVVLDQNSFHRGGDVWG